MKKIVFSVVAALLLAASLCGCGEKKTNSASQDSLVSTSGIDENTELNQHIQEIHPEFVSLKENSNTKILTSVKETSGLKIYEEAVFNDKGDMVLADYFKRVEAIDSAKADAKVQEWKDILGNTLEYASVEYVDGNVVVEYCTTNIMAILNLGVLPSMDKEKQLKEGSGFNCRID